MCENGCVGRNACGWHCARHAGTGFTKWSLLIHCLCSCKWCLSFKYIAFKLFLFLFSWNVKQQRFLFIFPFTDVWGSRLSNLPAWRHCRCPFWEVLLCSALACIQCVACAQKHVVHLLPILLYSFFWFIVRFCYLLRKKYQKIMNIPGSRMLATVKTTQRLNFCKSLLALGNLLSKTSGKTNVGGSCFVMIFCKWFSVMGLLSLLYFSISPCKEHCSLFSFRCSCCLLFFKYS